MTSAATAEIATPVLIVGGGPVGMTLAMSLHAFGVRTLVVNSDMTPRWHPKGATQNARTMEHYRRLGVSRALRGLGLPPDHPTDVGYFTRLTGLGAGAAQHAVRAREDGCRRQCRVRPIRCPSRSCAANQMYRRGRSLPAYRDARRRRGALRLAMPRLCRATATASRAEIEEVETGRRQRVGRLCHRLRRRPGRGAAQARRALRRRRAGRTRAYLSGPQVATYLRAPGLHERHPASGLLAVLDRQPRCAQHAHDASTAPANFSSAPRCRGPTDEPDPAIIARQLLAQPSAQRARSSDSIGHRPWTAGQALVADSFGAGRVDPCRRRRASLHAHGRLRPQHRRSTTRSISAGSSPPWCRDGADRNCSPSYRDRAPPDRLSQHRLPRRSLARSVGAVPIGAAMRRGLRRRARRDAARGGAVLAGFGEEFASLGVQLGARYDGSPIVCRDGTSRRPTIPSRYVPSACPGGRAPHLWLGRRNSLFDRLGRCFTLIRFAGSAADGARSRRRPRRAACRSKTLEIDLAAGARSLRLRPRPHPPGLARRLARQSPA